MTQKSWMFSGSSEMYMYPSDFCLVSLTKPLSSSLPPLSSPCPSQEHNCRGYKASSPQMRTCLGAGRKMSSRHELVLYLYTTHTHAAKRRPGMSPQMLKRVNRWETSFPSSLTSTPLTFSSINERKDEERAGASTEVHIPQCYFLVS